METVFKVGQKVYDEVNFPDKEGVVIDTNKNNKLNLLVKFDNVNYLYTLKGIYLGCKGTPTLSTKPYKVEFQGFEQKAPVPTFEEAWNNSHNSKEIFYSSNCDKVCSGYPTQELADASEALRRLLFLRDYYNEGWQPDWNTSGFKQCIELEGEVVCGRDHAYSSRVLAFKSGEIRDNFLKDQKELLEIAKPLL